jgi:hypothetical protein
MRGLREITLEYKHEHEHMSLVQNDLFLQVGYTGFCLLR